MVFYKLFCYSKYFKMKFILLNIYDNFSLNTSLLKKNLEFIFFNTDIFDIFFTYKNNLLIL